MLHSLFQMSVTTYWDGAACVDWVQGCSAKFVSMLENTYTNDVLAEPLSADLNGDFMADLTDIDFQSTWPLGMADSAPSRESSPGSKPAKNTRSHSQSRRESRNVIPALSTLSSHQTTSSAQSSPFKGAGSPKKTI